MNTIPAECLNYLPKDLAAYLEMKQQQKELFSQGKTLCDAPELWKRFEELRNKYGGLPPKQLFM